MKMTKQDIDQLKTEIDHILDSGVNDIRLIEMIERFISSRYVPKEINLRTLIIQFEQRNNLSIYILLFSDGSSTLMDFWSDSTIAEFDEFAELETYLKVTQYELDPSGRCYSPLKVKR